MSGLGIPEIILLLIAAVMFVSWVLLGYWGYHAGKVRSIRPVGGALLGLFLHFIGIIIVYCFPKNVSYGFGNNYYQPAASAVDEIQKLKQLLDNGAITTEEYNIQKARILNR